MGYCIHCGYDLKSHALGEKCPECGLVAKRIAPAPLPSPALAVAALAVVLIIPFIWIFGGWRGSYYALCIAGFMVVLLLVITILQYRRIRQVSHVCTLLLCSAAAIIPLLTLFLFTYCFVIHRSSNVAQMAGGAGADYWSLWAGTWPMLLLGNPVCVVFAVIALALPPYHHRYVASWALPISVLIAAVAAANIAVTYFPDA